MNLQFWLVGLSNTIHLLSTVIWIGWSALLPLVIAPRIIEAHRQGQGWLITLANRLPPLAYGALGALGATGMIQMSAHPHYQGLFTLTNLWSGLLFAKHLLILISVALIFYLGQSIRPQLRLAIRREALGKANNLDSLVARFRTIAWLNFAASIGVLLLTGLMTAIR
ncbi:MAG: hypothetical protein ACPGWR_31910 [Ardenticatenaceae bacterium]